MQHRQDHVSFFILFISIFLKNGPTPASILFIFVLFKHKFNRKTIVVSGIRTRIVDRSRRVEGEHADHLTTTTAHFFLCCNVRAFSCLSLFMSSLCHVTLIVSFLLSFLTFHLSMYVDFKPKRPYIIPSLLTVCLSFLATTYFQSIIVYQSLHISIFVYLHIQLTLYILICGYQSVYTRCTYSLIWTFSV